MMTESDIRKLLAKAEPFHPTVELYDIDEIAGPLPGMKCVTVLPASYPTDGLMRIKPWGGGLLIVHPTEPPYFLSSTDELAELRADAISAEVDAFLARDPTP